MADKPTAQSQYRSSSLSIDILPLPSHNPYEGPSAGENFATLVAPDWNTSVSNEIGLSNERNIRVMPPISSARCVVCGGKATARYYGVIGCASCGSFFQRSVENDSYLKYVCRRVGFCIIDVRTKHSCSFCRFRKCITLGMDLDRVSLAEERNLIDIIHCQQEKWDTIESTPQPHCSHSPVVVKADCLTTDDQIEIASIIKTYHQACTRFPFRQQSSGWERSTWEIVQTCCIAFRRIIHFSKLIEEFSSLPAYNQVGLLRTSVLEIYMLRGTICFDMREKKWPNSEIGSPGEFPNIAKSELLAIISSPLFCLDMDFMFSMQNLGIDEPIAMLLAMALLFNPYRVEAESRDQIRKIRFKYVLLLQKYAHLKYGSSEGTLVCLKFIRKLRALTKLGHFHDKHLVKLNDCAINIIGNLFALELDAILLSDAKNITNETSARVIPDPTEIPANDISVNVTTSKSTTTSYASGGGRT